MHVSAASGGRFFEKCWAATLSRFLYRTAFLPKKLRIPPLIVPDIFENKLRLIGNWLRQWKPDVLLARDYEISDILNQCFGTEVPRPRIVQLQLNEWTPGVSGIDEKKNEEVGSAAVNLLCGKLHHREFGSSHLSHELLIKGVFKKIK